MESAGGKCPEQGLEKEKRKMGWNAKEKKGSERAHHAGCRNMFIKMK
jgi:hypothetical protein